MSYPFYDIINVCYISEILFSIRKLINILVMVIYTISNFFKYFFLKNVFEKLFNKGT